MRQYAKKDDSGGAGGRLTQDKLAHSADDVDGAREDIRDEVDDAGEEADDGVEEGLEDVVEGVEDGREELVEAVEEVLEGVGDGHSCGCLALFVCVYVCVLVV